MLKAALAFLAIAAGSAIAVRTGETIYSDFQFQIPAGTALKVAPDAANIWSWHKQISLDTQRTHVSQPVLVDFDGNGRMDTEYSNLRVLITDMQVVFNQPPVNGPVRAWLSDGTRSQWVLFQMTINLSRDDSNHRQEHHLSTPLVLPVGATPSVEIDYPINYPATADVHLIGRVVTL